MSRPDAYHDAVRRALEKDGWTITRDALILSDGVRDIYEVIEEWIEPETMPPSSGG